MKKAILFVLFMSFFGVKAQKVDLDRFYFNVNYQILPKEGVPYEKRTYSSTVKCGGAIQSYVDPATLNDKIHIAGWKKVESGGTVQIELNLEDFVEKGATPGIRTDEKRDKDGKVISRKDYHFVSAKYATRGYAKVKGPVTPVAVVAKPVEQAKPAEAPPTTNRFLKNAVIKKDTTSASVVAAATEGFNLSFNGELEYKSSEYETSSAALKDFYINKGAIRDQMLRSFSDNSMSTFNSSVNSTYGYRAKSDNEILWILDAKSDEGKTQIEAIQAVKALFATMKADEPIDDLKSNMQPLIEYFDSLKTKYTEDNKPSRKMRYSAYFNLAVIYLMLDQPEKAITESEKLIENDYDKSDGKAIIEKANKLIASFKAAKTNTTHNPVLK